MTVTTTTTLSIENAVISIFEVIAADSPLLIFKLTVEITIAATSGPVKISAFCVASTNAFAIEFLQDCRNLDVAISIPLELTLVSCEAGIICDVPHVSVTIIAPHSSVVTRQIFFGFFPVIAT
eukprot:754246_1